MSRLIPQNDCDDCQVAKYCGDKGNVIICFVKTELEYMAERIKVDMVDEISKEIDRLDSQGGGIDDLQFFLEQLKEKK